jgi:hypothetical protein
MPYTAMRDEVKALGEWISEQLKTQVVEIMQRVSGEGAEADTLLGGLSRQ